ncbi:hypothetical protein J3E68DRAFT_439988 [Trichoderma sp. SZMC 28012]
MPSRRWHSKSRLGCAPCKRRRVKCDMNTPVCGRCYRYGEHCPFADTTAARGASIEALQAGIVIWDSSLSASEDIYNLSPSMLLLTKSAQCEASLIFHEAQQHVFAKQALNALSVLFCQGQAAINSIKAHAWHLKASAGFHASVAGKIVSTYFAQWIFGLATTVFQIRLCVTHPREDAIAETFHLLRGTARLAVAIAPRFMQDQRLAHDRTKDTGAKIDPEFLERIKILKTNIRMVEPNEESLIQAAELLQTWCVSIQGQPRTWLHILSWPALVSEDFVTKLHCKNKNRSVALAIFLHWCVIMIRFDDTWFLNGWITQLAQQAWAQLGGGWESTVIPAVRALQLGPKEERIKACRGKG